MKLSGRTVIVVDDGIATGASMRVAVEALRPRQPARVVIAVPVAPADCRVACQHRRRIRVHACRRLFPACGEFYENFDQTTDMQVRALFALARGRTVMHAVAASFLAVRDLTQPLANDDDDRAYDALVKMASL